MNTIVGKVLSIGQAVNVSKTKEYLKREVILDCSRYDQYTVQLSFSGKNVDAPSSFKQGDLVEVSFYLSGRKWENKIIMDIVGVNMEAKGRRAEQSQAAQANAPQPVQEAALQGQRQEGDLPF